MSDVSNILAAFQAVPELAGEWAVEPIGEKIFRAQCNGRSFFVKWITADDRRGRNELEIKCTVLVDAPISTPRLLHVIPSGTDSLAVWEWVEGDDLRSAHRELLPEAFRRLGVFHASQRGNCPVSSPITGQIYETVQALIEGELRTLCADLSPARRDRCACILQRLSCGYPTLIHGDMHPGNLFATSSGPLFVDWGYSRCSINLLDLDYVRSIPIQPPETDWWIIQPEKAGEVLSAYFSTCGLPDVNVKETHHAVMVWAMLWSLYQLRQSKDSATRAICQQRLDFLLEAQP